MRPIYLVDLPWGEHPGIVLSNRTRRLVNPKVTILPGQSAENLPLVAQLTVDAEATNGLYHRTYFALDEIVTVRQHLLVEQLGVLDADREPELMAKLTDAWDLYRTPGFPVEW